MDYELYHDESKVNGYWHGILLVPVEQKHHVVDLLDEARKQCKYQGPMGIKRISERKRIFNCARSWVNIGFAALRSKTKNEIFPLYLGNWGKTITRPECKDAKFLLFREKNNFQDMQYFRDYGSKVETTFRFGLKGGVHSLFSDENPINIVKLHFDGHEHYARHIDRERIIGRLRGLRDYISITEDIDDRSSNHKLQNSQPHEDCQLLQLTDLLIGCFRSALGCYTQPLHLELSAPVKDYLHKARKGNARLQNSRWCNSIWMSQCYLEQGDWIFEPLEIEYKDSYIQPNLF